MKDQFNIYSSDSQASKVQPLRPEEFDFDAYAEYEARLNQGCKKFWEATSGVMVYRRMRVKEVFAEDSADWQKSLHWQLGALQQSTAYKADIPNFLEPWYGIGTIASAYGFGYRWEQGQAPALNGKFEQLEHLLQADFKPVAQTAIGKHSMEMAEYFLEQTRGRLPMSWCDVQSPLNVLCNLVDSNMLFPEFYLNPGPVEQAMDRITDLLIEFTKLQTELIGPALAKPGHGFASSRFFEGFGMSDDNIVMLPPELYMNFAMPRMIRAGQPFGGPVFHSCGNWSDKKEDIARMAGLRMADGAFSKATDPDANPCEGFAAAFAHTGIVLNARIVGNLETLGQKVKQLWAPGMKLIVVTYCESPQEQAAAYDLIHEICRE